MNDELNINATDTLAECETVIERGLQTFVQVGLALASIRDLKLYTLAHGTFEIYLHKRWDLSPSRAYQMIESSRITRELSTIVDTDVLPRTESQARELTGLEPGQAATVMSQTATRIQGKLTAKKIRETRERLFTPPPLDPPKAHPPQREPIAHVDDEHTFCDDESFYTRQALVTWDENPPVNRTYDSVASLEFREWFGEVVGKHYLCFDPYVLAGVIASFLDVERKLDGGRVLARLGEEISLFHHRLRNESAGGAA